MEYFRTILDKCEPIFPEVFITFLLISLHIIQRKDVVSSFDSVGGLGKSPSSLRRLI